MRADYASRFLGRPVSELPTPCLTLDLALLERNLDTLQGDVARAGKELRPHAKSHKCSRLARLQQEHGAIGICAAKLSEAEGLLAAGLKGVLLTGPAVSREAHRRLADCWVKKADLTMTLGSESGARALSGRLAEAARALPGEPPAPLPFLLDIDIGQERTGVLPQNAVEAAARISELPHLRMVGIQAYAGHLQHLRSREERREATLEAVSRAVPVYRQLRGGEVAIFSVGGTGSYRFDLEVEEVTEVQPGSYALMDADYLAVEASEGAGWRFAPALELRSTVLSRRPQGFVTLDAGLKSLYRDGPAPLVVQPEGGTLVYDWFGDEYGRLSGSAPEMACFQEGDAVRLIVSHCDPTVNLFDFFYVIREGIVTDLWPIDLRGCSH